MGNFQVDEPTKAQLNALVKLTTALVVKYKINPDNNVYAHIEDDAYPYIKDEIRPAIMGHRDTGKTACPGINLYNKLDLIRAAVKKNLQRMGKHFPLVPLTIVYRINKHIFNAEDTTTITL